MFKTQYEHEFFIKLYNQISIKLFICNAKQNEKFV